MIKVGKIYRFRNHKHIPDLDCIGKVTSIKVLTARKTSIKVEILLVFSDSKVDVGSVDWTLEHFTSPTPQPILNIKV